MALTADEKERIMSARGETSRASSNTTYYRVIFPCGKTFPMISMAGRNYDDALDYARGIWKDCDIEEM